jgi:hypothetical protein
MSESNKKIKAKNIWMRRQDQSVVVYEEEDLEEKPDMILEQDFHVDL